MAEGQEQRALLNADMWVGDREMPARGAWVSRHPAPSCRRRRPGRCRGHGAVTRCQSPGGTLGAPQRSSLAASGPPSPLPAPLVGEGRALVGLAPNAHGKLAACVPSPGLPGGWWHCGSPGRDGSRQQVTVCTVHSSEHITWDSGIPPAPRPATGAQPWPLRGPSVLRRPAGAHPASSFPGFC